MDRSQRREKYTKADFLPHAGIPTMRDLAHAIMHNDVMVLDGETVITGAFDFAQAAGEERRKFTCNPR